MKTTLKNRLTGKFAAFALIAAAFIPATAAEPDEEKNLSANNAETNEAYSRIESLVNKMEKSIVYEAPYLEDVVLFDAELEEAYIRIDNLIAAKEMTLAYYAPDANIVDAYKRIDSLTASAETVMAYKAPDAGLYEYGSDVAESLARIEKLEMELAAAAVYSAPDVTAPAILAVDLEKAHERLNELVMETENTIKYVAPVETENVTVEFVYFAEDSNEGAESDIERKTLPEPLNTVSSIMVVSF